MGEVKVPTPNVSDATSIKDGTYTDIVASPSINEVTDFAAMTAEEIAAFQIDPKVEAEVRWQYDKVSPVCTWTTNDADEAPAYPSRSLLHVLFLCAGKSEEYPPYLLSLAYTQCRTEATLATPKPTTSTRTSAYTKTNTTQY